MNVIENMRRKAATKLLIGGHRGHCPGFLPGEGAPASVQGDVPTLGDLAACTVRENTVANFALLRDVGLSHIEVDVQLTADDEAVIYHDLDLAARSPLSGTIRNHTLAQLKDAFPIDTLDEVLDWCAGADMPVALELKCVLLDMHQTMPLLACRIVEALQRHRLFEMSFVLSTNHASLAHIKALAPKTNLAPIVPHVPHNPLRLMEELDASIYLCFQENLCPDLVASLQKNGYFVDGSVVNGSHRLSRAIALGVDMIESDCPLHTMAQYRRLTRA